MEDRNKLVLESLNSRFACKRYDPEKSVSDEDFMTIMEAGRLSPSSFGYEPWKFVLLNNEKIRQRIYSHAWGAQASLNGASHFLIVLSRTGNQMKYDSEYIRHIIEDVQNFPEELIEQRLEKFEDFQKNDFKLLKNEDKLSDWASKQTYIALGIMLMTAAILGVDSTPIEGFNKEAVEKILVEEEVYNPEEFQLSYMLAFGYTNREHRPKTRREMAEVFQIID